MRFGTANKLGLVGVLREQCSLVELPTFALRTRRSPKLNYVPGYGGIPR